MASLRDLVDELKRRRVFRTAAAYAVVAWLLIQVADTTFPALGLPEWGLKAVIVTALLGFPVALVLAWAYEVTGGSLRRTAGSGGPSGLAVGSFVGVVIGAALAAGIVVFRSAPTDTDARRSAAPEASVAVLPFADLSSGQDRAFFAEGLAEELLNTLARLEGLRVAARTSSFAFRGPDTPPVTEIGARLGVATVLEGSVRTQGDSVRVWAQLVDARDGLDLWTETYQRPAADIFAIQDEIARAIANALEVRLLGETSLERHRPRDPEAYQAYLQGRYAWNQRTPESLHESITHFERAARIDPGYALAYAGLADAYMILEDFGELTRDEAFSKGTAAARRALQIDETLAEAHTSLAHILMHQREYEEGRREFERAIELNPSLATAHQWFALLLMLTEQWAEADEHASHAVALDPLSLAPLRTHALVPFMARRYDEAVLRFEAALERHPDNDQLLDWMVDVHVARGRADEAVEVARRLVEAFPNSSYYRAQAAVAYAAAGRRADAERELARRSEAGSTPKRAIAFAHLGDFDRAFAELDRAADVREAELDFLVINPAYDPLRSDPRFEALLQRTGHTP